MTEKITKRVEKITTINFSITKCPHKVYQKFVEYCKNETNDNYSMGLKMLVDAIEANIKEALLFEQYMELKARMDELENKSSDRVKTFGAK